MKNKLSNSTSPGHCANIVLGDVATSTHSKHSCTGLGGVSASVAWACVRNGGTCPIFIGLNDVNHEPLVTKYVLSLQSFL